ncbi:MAG: hypothetical protein H0T46_21430 [Deltaproteobacteria bacterium]|nr:hypothetical protein [Deltaproteobacteria bacterium]
MQPAPSDTDWEHKSYQGAFMFQWKEFEREFGDFWAERAHSWTDRMWRGSYDQAVEYRRRLLEWRQSFVALGGRPTSPAPRPPVEEILPGISLSLKSVALFGGLAIGALFVVPAALNAIRRPA